MMTTLTAKRPNVAIPAPRRAFIPGPRRPAETIMQPPLGPGPGEMLHIHINKRRGYTVVYLAGELDLTASEIAYPTLVNLLRETDPRLIFDMGGVIFARNGAPVRWNGPRMLSSVNCRLRGCWPAGGSCRYSA